MKRCVLLLVCCFLAATLQARRGRVKDGGAVASGAVVASAADVPSGEASATGSAGVKRKLPPISNASVSPVREEEADALLDEAEASATVPLDEPFISEDLTDGKSGGESYVEQLPLEPGGGEGLLGPVTGHHDENVAEVNAEPARLAPDIPGLDNPLVAKYRGYYLAPERVKWLSAVLENGEQYRLYVRAKLKECGMPSYLEYLPVVESSYKTNARSRTGALGLWQFMANSTKGFLVRDDFVDERLDPWRSTDAALAKLMANYKQFGDWPLALAAYNCGAGAMQGILRRNPGKDYWQLAEAGSLRKETMQYVPRLVAIADICENTAHYGVDLPTACGEDGESANPRAGYFDYVETNKAVSLRRLAASLKIDEDMLVSMNPALYREITPPHLAYTVRVPEGMGEAGAFAFAEAPPYHFPTRYTVVAGDSLWKISRAFRVTVAALCDANSIKETSTLKVGKVLDIPN